LRLGLLTMSESGYANPMAEAAPLQLRRRPAYSAAQPPKFTMQLAAPLIARYAELRFSALS
jgi:hypothetical protein